MPARETLADLFDDLNRQSDRIEQLEALAALEPDRTERYVALAMARAETGRTEHGGARARPRGGAASGRHARATRRSRPCGCGLPRRQGDPAALARALDATRTVMAHGEPTPADLLLHGRALLLSGDAAGALPVLRAATAQLPVDPRAYETLATAAERADRLPEAKDALERLRTLARDERTEAAICARIADARAPPEGSRPTPSAGSNARCGPRRATPPFCRVSRRRSWPSGAPALARETVAAGGGGRHQLPHPAAGQRAAREAVVRGR